MLFMFSIGIVFLAFDMQFRDRRERISEVLDCQPVWDFEVVVGRLLGVVLLLTISAIVLTVAMCLYGALAEIFDFELGTPIESYSVIAFLVWDIVPNLVFWGSITMLLAAVLKSRFLVLLAAFVSLCSVFLLNAVLPFSFSSLFSMHASMSAYPSELTPTFVTWAVLIIRGLMLVVACGCLAFAALLQSRNQSTKEFKQLLFCGALAILFALAGAIAHLVVNLYSESSIKNWTNVHKNHQSHSSTDIQMISGTIDINPGQTLKLDLTLAMNSTEDTQVDDWLFSLNPGYRITKLDVNGAPSGAYKFEDGLLHVPREGSVAPHEIRIVANGKPNKRFAYLDSALDWKALNGIGAKRIFSYGQESFIFHRNFVALMSGISWIPASGSAYGRDELESRHRDFFFLDLEVSVPLGWLVAAPGSRDVLDTNGSSTYRLRTRNPIPELTLLSSKFEQRLISVDGIDYELLVNKKHIRNVHTFDDIAPRIRVWLAEQSKRLRNLGLEYPYTRLSLVEVPTSLRTYGGGWRMDSVFSAPGIQMIRESGFPTAPFSRRYSRMRDQFEEQNTRFQNYMLDGLVAFFANDLHGGNPLEGIPKIFVDFQTVPTGKGATALRYVVNQLAMRLATNRSDGYFSVQTAVTKGITAEPRIFSRSTSFFGGGTVYLRNWSKEYADRPSVWDLLDETALASIDFYSDPEDALHALVLKGQRAAAALIDRFGEVHVGKFLHHLVDRFRGDAYTYEDFRRTALDVGMDIEATIGDWLNQTGMAGFVVDDLKNERLANDEEGRTIYQTSFTLSNTESPPGVAKISYQSKDRIGLFWEPVPLDPVHVPGNTSVRVAFQDVNPTQRVWIEPRLALNRDPIRLEFPVLLNEKPSDSPKFPYVTQIAWKSVGVNEIIVDDLDDGFSIVDLPFSFRRSLIPKWIENVALVPEQEWDRGLPVLNRSVQVSFLGNRLNPLSAIILQRRLRERRDWWFRESDPTSFGKYRRTFAGRSGGRDHSKPVFSTSLSNSGTWKLEYHMPLTMRSAIEFHGMRSPGDLAVEETAYDLGTYTIHILDGDQQAYVEFDAASSLPGWNELGTFELSNSKVDVVVAEVSHGLVVADAIRWSPL